MSYVLTVIHPPVAPAAYGRALVPMQEPFSSVGAATQMVVYTFTRLAGGAATPGEAKEIGRGLVDAPGREIKHAPSGLTFRIDPADQAPHPCPCGEGEDNPCGRLVLPTDHTFAHVEDAYCLGCFTWSRNVPGCLPTNSAHTEEP